MRSSLTSDWLDRDVTTDTSSTARALGLLWEASTIERSHTVEDQTPDRPVTIQDLKSLQNGGQKVRLTAGALLTLGGMVLTMVAMAAALAWSVFQTEAQASDQHSKIKLGVQEAFSTHSATPHPVSASQDDLKEVTSDLHKLDKKITVIGARRGLQDEMRKIDEEHKAAP